MITFVRNPLLVCAHTEPQLRRFLISARLMRGEVRRVLDLRDIEGRASPHPLLLLPDWRLSPVGEIQGGDRLLAAWRSMGGNVLWITEDQVLGKTPLCSNDTNDDGDCHLCIRKGGCPWPNIP